MLAQSTLNPFISRYTQRTKTSKQIAQTYRRVLADPKGLSAFRPQLKEICYPVVGKSGQGSRLWDVDDNEYIDLVMGFGVNLFGHNPPFIQTALEERLKQGIQMGPQPELAGQVAQKICDLTGVERVALSNTGTEAVMSAIRLARAVTGRSKIAMFVGSYHGHSDHTLVKPHWENGALQAIANSPGVPAPFVDEVILLEYGQEQSLGRIAAQAEGLAAVLVEPVQSARPDLQPKAFLQQLRRLTQEKDIALIFDEMITGFRLHPGGAQAWFGVEADLVTYGKVLGGGMPIGAIAGKAIYLDKIDGGLWHYGDDSYPKGDRIFFAGTYCKHPLAMTAALAVLQHLQAQGPSLQAHLNQRTSDFIKRLNRYFAEKSLPIQMANCGSMFNTVSANNGSSSANNSSVSALDLIYYYLVEQGIFIQGGSFLSTAHTDEDLEQILEGIDRSIQALWADGSR